MQAGRLQRIYDDYKDRAHIYLVYIREAHAKDGRRPIPVAEGVEIFTAKSLEDRRDNARQCVADLGLSIPAVLDSMDNATEKAYAAWPDRLVVIDREGRVTYPGQRGPFGFDPDEAQRELAKLIRESE